MPASDISRISTVSVWRRDAASQIAFNNAKHHLRTKIECGLIRRDDHKTQQHEFKIIYEAEYLKIYNLLPLDQPGPSKVIYVPTQNPSATKYISRHCLSVFSKNNCLINVRPGYITVSKFEYPFDEDISPETKEAFLLSWPGPLDRRDEDLKIKVTKYIDTLWQNDSQRRIKYCDVSNDEQRKTILKLLTELLHRNGTIDAPGITRLLLKPEQTEIQKDESTKKPLETFKKYLLLGKQDEAIRFAKSRRLYEHAFALTLLYRFQPPNTNNFVREADKLKDDSLVQLIDEFIAGVGESKINLVYKALLDRILQSDPESRNITHLPNVGNDEYNFAILSANDCAMNFDQSNEIFKLIASIKQALNQPTTMSNHLISLGYTNIDSNDMSEDFSYRSLSYFNKTDTYASRTLTISNIDMLILNEIWEYCLNLASGTSDPSNYNYIINLVPYKLMFACKLLDFGLHQMFADYLTSIQKALDKAKQNPHIERDQFYDWETIEDCVRYLTNLWTIFQHSNMDPAIRGNESPTWTPATQQRPYVDNFNYNQPSGYDDRTSNLPYQFQNVAQNDYIDSSTNDYPNSIPYQVESAYNHNYTPDQSAQKQNLPNPAFNQQEIMNNFNPDPLPNEDGISAENAHQQPTFNDTSNQPSRRQSESRSMEMPVFSPPSFGMPSQQRRQTQRTMTTSSPVEKSRDLPHLNQASESFNTPFSPINQDHDELASLDSDSRRTSLATGIVPGNSMGNVNSQMMGSNRGNNSSSNNNNSTSKPAQPSGDQQSGFFTNYIAPLLHKSNSKQIFLPDDSNKAIVYDQAKGSWVDTSNPDASDGIDPDEAPPMMKISEPPTYSFGAKPSRMRYPKV